MNRRRQGGASRVLVGAAVLVFSTVAAPRVSKAVTSTIMFDTLPNNGSITAGMALNVQYSGEFGVTFEAEPSGTMPTFQSSGVPTAASPPFVAMSPNFSKEFDSSPFAIKFASAQSQVSLVAGSDCTPATGTLTAFNAAGTPVATDGPIALAASLTSTPFTVTAPGGESIFSVSFSAVGPNGPGIAGCDASIDNLTFTGEAAPATPAGPFIQLITPDAGNGDFTEQALTASGVVTGTSLFNIVVDLTSLNPAPGQSPTQEFVFPFNPEPTGNEIPFSFQLRKDGQLPVGNYTLVATVTDAFGQSAQATVSFSNIPPDLTGNVPNLGPLQYGVIAEDCELAFYPGGALALPPTNGDVTAIFVPTPIAMKWLEVAQLSPPAPVFYPFKTLGCPTAAASDFSGFNQNSLPSDWKIQQFEHGRVYAPNTGSTVYVPAILTNALHALGHFSGIGNEFFYVGAPVADPSWNEDTTNPTWVFQRFDQNGLGPNYQNTIEIRERTPLMRVERIGGDLTELSLAQATPTLPMPTAKVDDKTPTIWQVFPCTMASTDRFPTSCDLSSLAVDQSPPNSGISGAAACSANLDCEASPDGCKNDSECGDAQFGHADGSGAPDEWVDITPSTQVPGTDNVVPNVLPTTYEGIVRTLDVNGPDPGPHLANVDYFVDHQECQTSTGGTFEEAGAVFLTLLGCGTAASWAVWLVTGSEVNLCSDAASNLHDTFADNCRSDWNLHTRPLPNPKNWGFLSTGNYMEIVNFASDFEIEWEDAFSVNDGYFKEFQPQVGNLVSAHGRPNHRLRALPLQGGDSPARHGHGIDGIHKLPRAHVPADAIHGRLRVGERLSGGGEVRHRDRVAAAAHVGDGKSAGAAAPPRVLQAGERRQRPGHAGRVGAQRHGVGLRQQHPGGRRRRVDVS